MRLRHPCAAAAGRSYQLADGVGEPGPRAVALRGAGADRLMQADVGLSVWVLVGLVAFVLLFVFVVWLGLKQKRELHQSLDRRVAAEGWVFPTDASVITQRGWNWFASLRSGRDVAVDHLAVNPAPGLSEAAFTLVTRRYGGRLGARRVVGFGLVARLPRSISPRIVVLPQTAGLRLFERFFRFELPGVALTDPRLAHSWSISSPEPEAAADKLEADPALRSALIAVAEEALGHTPAEKRRRRGPRISVGHRPKFQILMLELDGDRLALVGGPKTVGSQPFSDLEELAARLVGRLGSSAPRAT
jgi:hypothetical protein